jgi:N,N-dimethylformamidase beta subunit-like, C-terminal/Cell wall binding domain 2 (CWB2)
MKRNARTAPFSAAIALALLAALAPAATHASAAPAAATLAAAAAPANPIVLENRHPGTADWKIPWSGKSVANDTSQQVKGYLSDTSVPRGESIGLHVKATAASTFTWHVFRLGWYGGAGGRLMLNGSASSSTQPTCPTDSETGEIACAWSRSATIQTGSDWTTGVYVVVLTSGAYQNYAFFSVRDGREGALLALSPVNTYQAYNNFPSDGLTGKSLYDYNSYGKLTVNGTPAAVKVSFDRPYATTGVNYVLRDELPFIRYAESRGFDLTYATDVDLHRTPGIAAGQRAIVSVGHSEYWSGTMYTAAENARDAGIGLAALGANNVYWQVRYENAANGTPNRVLVCYRIADLDPEPVLAQKSILFRDAGRPEQSLLGQMYAAPGGLVPASHPWVVTSASHWFYRGTGVANGDSIPLMVGDETDQRQPGYPLPDYTTFSVLAHSPTVDRYGDPAIAEATLYAAPSGAAVFDAGTLKYTRALGQSGYIDPRAQGMTTNLLARDSSFRSTVTTARLGGTDRYGTSALISAKTFAAGVPAVYLATGATYPDALAASAASRGQAPILLVHSDSIPSVVATELARLAPQEVRVVGGEGVVSTSVATQAGTLTGAPVVRIAGADRYATAVAISAASFAPGAPVAYVATGTNFPDALAAGAAGAQLGGPVLLARSTGLDSKTLAEVKRLAPKRIVVVGGADIVSTSVEATLDTIAPTVRRSGPDRYETSREVARDLHQAGAGPLVALATGADFPDALAAGPMVAHAAGTLVLVKASLDPAAAEEIVRNDPADLRYVGGSSVVTSAVVTASKKLFDSVDGVTAAPTVESAPPMAKSQVTPSSPSDEPVVKDNWRDQLPWLTPTP